MVNFKTQMRFEIDQIPSAIERILLNSEQDIGDISNKIRAFDPKYVCTVARGSSDHAAHYLKYAIELIAKIPVASIGPSVNSIYEVDLNMTDCMVLGISQSGRSPDILSMMNSANKNGGMTVSLTSDITSPLAGISHHSLDIQAQLETSVAATKTFITTIVTGLMLLAHWVEDQELLDSLHKLPKQAQKALGLDWPRLRGRLKHETSICVLGRGPSFAIANEIALKFKETCQLHGEAYSSAEFMHGPISIVGDSFPILELILKDASICSMIEVGNTLIDRNSDLFTTSKGVKSAVVLVCVSSGHPIIDPLLQCITFYSFVEKLAQLRGLHPDAPRYLKKVTETI